MQKIKRFYFANQTCNRKEGREISMRIHANTNVYVDNPFYDPEGNPTKEIHELDTHGTSRVNKFEITATDLNKVREADGVIAFINEDKLALGTCWEMCFAKEGLGRELYVISKIPSIQEHPFLVYYGVPVFKTSYEFIEFAQKKWGKPERKVSNKWFPKWF